MQINKLNQKYEATKLSNLFLGFFEGLFIDEKVHAREIESLIKWVETYPNCVNIPHFSILYDFLVRSFEEPLFLINNKTKMKEIFKQFKSSSFFLEGTADIQRLHGLLAGMVCDKDLRDEEIIGLKNWLKSNLLFQYNFIYQDLTLLLEDIKDDHLVDSLIKDKLKAYISKYVNIDDEGLPLVVVSANENSFINPDFYFDELLINGNTFCLTGASNRFMKSEWKNLIELKGGVFTDSITKKVDYLVICNKGNPHWVHMSYGRKFEQAKKMQHEKHDIRILTEDYFMSFLE